MSGSFSGQSPQNFEPPAFRSARSVETVGPVQTSWIDDARASPRTRLPYGSAQPQTSRPSQSMTSVLHGQVHWNRVARKFRDIETLSYYPAMRLLAILVTLVSQPFAGITYIDRTETSPRAVHMHIVQVDLSAPGLRFKLSPPSGGREVIRQTTLDYLTQEGAQVAINAHFFLPFPSPDREAWLIGIAASEGRVYSSLRGARAVVCARPRRRGPQHRPREPRRRSSIAAFAEASAAKALTMAPRWRSRSHSGRQCRARRKSSRMA